MRIFKIAQINHEQQEFPLLDGIPINKSPALPNDKFKELLSENEYIPKNELKNVIQKQELNFEVFANLLKVSYNDQDYWFEDDDDGDYELVKDIQQWIYDISISDALDILQLKEEDIYADGVGKTLKDFRNNPQNVFHWTTEDKWEDIQKHGVLIGSSGTGINNHSAYGIFTSIDADEYSGGSYGNVCLEINLKEFHRDYGESLNIHIEPEMMERSIRETLADKMGVMESFEGSYDVSPQTIIVNHEIPLRYVQRID